MPEKNRKLTTQQVHSENSNSVTFYNMGWQTVPNINITTSFELQTTVTFSLLEQASGLCKIFYEPSYFDK